MRANALLPLLALGVVAQDASSSHSHALTRRDLQQMQRSIEARGLADDIWNKIKNAATCAGCQGILALLKGVALLGDDAVVDIGQAVCKLAKVQDDDVCDGAVALEGPIVAHAVRQMDLGSRSSDLFCSTVLGLCKYPDVAKWSVPVPPGKPTTGRPKPSGKDPIQIVHYSDIHIDPFYVEGSSTDCKKPICCRPYTDDDKPGNSKSPAGPNGDHKCDVPISLEESMYKAINKVAPNAAFALFTGDIVDHAVWNTTRPANEDSINSAYGYMNESLKLVYGTAGNHEASPVNGFQPQAVGDETQWVYDVLSSQWSHWIGNDAASEVEKIGAYSTKYPDGNLRVISLNTNLYYRANFWMFEKKMEKDPNGQIAWLVKELDAAEKAGERVYIMGHLPPGNSDAFRDASNYLDQVFNRYSSTIAAMFYGHTHVDHFEITYSDYKAQTAANAKIMSYISASLTPTSGMPSFRVYDVDPVTFAVLDSTVYIADMTNEAFQTTGPVWTKLYSAKEAYGPSVDPPLTDPKAELTPGFWHQVTEAFEADQSLFDAYISRKSRGWKHDSCTGDCKKNEICELRAARGQDNCYVPSPGFNLKKRAEEGHGEHDDCGVKVSEAALSALAANKEALDLLQEQFLAKGASLTDDAPAFMVAAEEKQ